MYNMLDVRDNLSNQVQAAPVQKTSGLMRKARMELEEEPYNAATSMLQHIQRYQDSVTIDEGIDTRAMTEISTTPPEGEMRSTSRGDMSSDTGKRLTQDLMRDFGLTREQAAGFVGNLDHETGGFKFMQEIEPVVPGSRGGYGFAQWTGPRRRAFEAWSEENNLPLDSYDANYGYLRHELENTSEGSVLNPLRNAANVTDAATIVSEKFLRPGKPNLGSRIRRSSGYLEGNF